MSDLKLSVSKVKTFLDCQKKYNFAYILKLPRKEFTFHTFGKFAHKVLEDFHNAYINGSTKPYAQEMNIAYKAALSEYKARMSQEMRDECWKIINQYLKIISKSGIPNVLACEKEFSFNISENIILNGMIDRVQLDDDGVVHVCDYKTVKSKSFLKNDSFQLLTYAYVLRTLDPTIEKVRGSYILLRHDYEYITMEFSKEDIDKIKDKYMDYANKMLTEMEFKAHPTVLCDYCEYMPLCEEGKKKSSLKFGEVQW